MISYRTCILGLAGVLLLSGCSQSASHAHDSKRDNPAKAIITAMDGDGNGYVTWQENQRYFAQLFTRLDMNHDGFVSEEEFKGIANDPLFKAMPLQKLQVSFTMFDRSDRHKLSHDDFEHMGDRIFTLLDRNMDGTISESDFAADEACVQGEQEKHAGGKGRHDGN